jgi:hypothetical protein
MQLRTMTLTSLHGRSTMEPDKSRMIHETMRLFVPALHGLTVTLFGKRSRLRPSLPSSLPLNTVLCKCCKARNPATNVPRRDEPMATDTIQSDTPAINGGEKYAQFFVGVHSLLSDVHGMKSPASFPGVLTDQIIDRRAPTKLISDSAKVEISMAVRDILCTYGISSWQSEPYHQHQTQPNGATRRSNACATPSLTARAPLPTVGCCA